MLNIKKIIIPVLTLVTVMSVIFCEAVFAADPAKSDSNLFPGLVEISHTHPDWLKPTIQMSPIPESEMVHIPFNTDWIFKNDVNPDPSAVQITFPVYWLEESQFVTDNDVVILSVPKLLINKFNQSKNSDEVTINFPNTYFTGLPVPPLRPVSESRLSEPIEGNVTLSMDYQQRIEYLHTSGDNILGAAGQTNPTYRYNPDSESFLAYHEIENYGSNGNDCIEVVTQYSNNTTSAKVFYCIYNNGVISVANPMFVSIDSTIDYTWYLEGTTYTVLLWDHVSDWIWGSAQDTTPPSDFYHFDGSSEFDTVGGLNGHICNVATYPVTITSLLTSSWQPASYVNTRLVYNLTTSPAQYVDIWSYKDSYGLQFYEYGGSSY